MTHIWVVRRQTVKGGEDVLCFRAFHCSHIFRKAVSLYMDLQVYGLYIDMCY